MPITGKLLGALIGSIAGPLGTILGGFIGHFFDRAAEERQFLGTASAARLAARDGWRGGRSGLPGPGQFPHLPDRAVHLGGGCGRHGAGLPRRGDEGLLPPQLFLRGGRPGPHPAPDRGDVPQPAEDRRGGSVRLLRRRFDIRGQGPPPAPALPDRARRCRGGDAATEEELILRIAAVLGLGETVFRQVRAEFMRDSGRALGGPRDPAGARASEEIKAAYRRLSLQHHPDRVANLGPEFVKVAEEKFKAIQQAYDDIRGEKGF